MDQPVRSFLLVPGQAYRIGRDPHCELCLDDPRVSREHARVTHVAGGWQIADLGSKNGVQVDGRDCDETVLEDGAWVSFGGLLGNFARLSDAQAADDRRRARLRWETTVDRSRRLDAAEGTDRVLRELLEAALDVAGAQRGFVMLPDEAGNLDIRARLTRGDPEPGDAFPGSRGAVQRVLESGRPVVACDVRRDAVLGARPSVEVGGVRALACVPLRVGEHITGVIYLDSRVVGKLFTELDIELLEAFASHAALVLGVAGLRGELADLARLLPADMGRGQGAGELVRRLQAAVPAVAGAPGAVGRLP